MALYFRILTSIFLSLIILSFFISCIAGIYTLNSDISGFSNALKLSMWFSIVGIVLFGFTGAFLWSLLFKFSNRFFRTDSKGHAFSSVLSTLISITAFDMIFGRNMSDTELLKLTIFLVTFILPTVLLSLYLYNKFYLNSDGTYIEKD